MRLARAWTADGIVTGEYEDGAIVTETARYPICESDAELLAPIEPTTLYCVGRNYAETLEQMDYDRPDKPDFFIKPPPRSIRLSARLRIRTSPRNSRTLANWPPSSRNGPGTSSQKRCRESSGDTPS